MSEFGRRNTSKLARAVGLLVVLGLPLALVSPLNPNGVPTETAAAARDGSTGAPVAADIAPPVEELDGYSPATAREASPDNLEIEIRESEPSAGDPVKTIVNDPRCGPGFSGVEGAAASSFFCVHTALDPLPEIAQPVAQSAGTAPTCQGNGVNGPRVQLLYMYVEGQPDRTAQVTPQILGGIVPRMESVFRETSKLQGREIGMRLHMPECQLSIETLMIEAANGEPTDPFTMSNRITEAVSRAGYSTTDRKYVVWFDGGNEGACGVAPAMTTLVPHVTDNAATGNISNIGWQAFLPETAIIFRYGQPFLGNAPSHVPECWGRGGTGARTEIHELIHLLGAVNKSAPNSNGLGHCTDDHDIMCYGEQGVSTVPRCATPVEQLDCGADDYFNARPSAGSYLSTHWNTANSRFLGEALVHDNVPMEIPRP